MAANKRVFTKIMAGSDVIDADTDFRTKQPISTWVAQEDLIIIGCNLSVHFGLINANDSEYHVRLELSQNPQFLRDSAIARVSAHQIWNSSPAAIDNESGNIVLTFPDTRAITMPEGDVLMLHLDGNTKGGAGTARVYWCVIVYYQKGKAVS